MTNEPTPLEILFKASVEDAVALTPECLEQIAQLLDGKSITVGGRECKLQMKRKRLNNYEGAAHVVEVLTPSSNLVALTFRITHEESRIREVPGVTD